VTAAPFDTLKLSRQLRERAHFSQEQAEDLAETLAEAFHEQIATKIDVQNAALSSQIVDLRKNSSENEEKFALPVQSKSRYPARWPFYSDPRFCQLRSEQVLQECCLSS
jgi:hypothetical protein